MDELAAEVGVDPLEIREKNWIKHEEFPFTTVAGLEYDSGNYEAATAQGQGDVRVRRAAGRAEAAPRRPATRSSSASASRRSPRCAAWRPSRVLGSARLRRRRLGARERADARHRQGRGGHRRVARTARATRRRSARSWPTGSASPFEDVEVLHGDTQVSHKGLDTYGSRSLVVGGEALVKAADKVIEKAKPIAAHLLEASVDDLEFAGGQVLGARHRPGHGDRRDRDRGLRRAQPARRRRSRRIDAEATYDPVNFNFPHGTHLCAMEVDTETGAVKMRKYVCVDDIGNIVNPLIVAGQVHGGLVQGIAQALWEEAVYDDAGTLVSGSFVDYLLPTAADTISFDIDHTTSPSTDQHARHQGRRRGRHHRLDPGRGQRGRRRRAPPRGQRHPDAVHARAGVEGDQRRPAPAARRPRVRRCRTSSPEAAGNRSSRQPRKERAMIPAAFDYVAPTTVEEALAALAAARRRRQDHRRRAEPAAGAADAAQRAGDGHRPRQDRRRCAASATTATPSSSAR